MELRSIKILFMVKFRTNAAPISSHILYIQGYFVNLTNVLLKLYGKPKTAISWMSANVCRRESTFIFRK